MQPLMPSSDEDSDEGDEMIPAFGLLNLCSDRIDAVGVYLLDTPDLILVYVCRSVSQQFTSDVLNCTSFNQLCEMVSRKYSPNDDDEADEFVWNVQNESRERMLFVGSLVEDRGDASGDNPSYYEFLQKIKNLVK
jgi:hypothetical protein